MNRLRVDDEAIKDYVEDHADELLGEWLEVRNNWEEFCLYILGYGECNLLSFAEWFFHKDQYDYKAISFNRFLDNTVASKRFWAWSTDIMVQRLRED